ncbi:hypothetical protein AX16_004838 [Volvariella volvacea WC 439]|nr:hypothetical protein AX16_004838 [Volvariella volvacea WC 439]
MKTIKPTLSSTCCRICRRACRKSRHLLVVGLGHSGAHRFAQLSRFSLSAHWLTRAPAATVFAFSTFLSSFAMYSFQDEGFTDEDASHSPASVANALHIAGPGFTSPISLSPSMNFPPTGAISVKECEDLAFRLLSSLPRSRLAAIQRRLVPLLQFDLVGSLPTEISLQIFSYLPAHTLLRCAFVSRRWHTLANDQTLWKMMCDARGWKWKSTLQRTQNVASLDMGDHANGSDDEGMGDSDEEGEVDATLRGSPHLDIASGRRHSVGEIPISNMGRSSGSFASSWLHRGSAGSLSADASMFMDVDSGFLPTNSMDVSPPRSHSMPGSSSVGWTRDYAHPSFDSKGKLPQTRLRLDTRLRTLAPSAPSPLPNKPNYKRLYLTHLKLIKRFLTSSYHLSYLQTRGSMADGHSNTIYCLQLYTYPSTGKQVLFTGSRDKTVREWNLQTRSVERVISGVHTSSVLSICVYNGYLASAGSDRKVVVWDLEKNELVRIIGDHEDSVLCVRINGDRLVSCSKDRTVRTYSFPDLTPQFVLDAHRSAVNAVAICQNLIVSASGDRSIRLWDATTGNLLRTLENHHTRGIASIDFKPPFVLSGSSDKHLRQFNMTTSQGWSTSLDYHPAFVPTDTEHHPTDLSVVLPFAASSSPLQPHAGEPLPGSSSASVDIASASRVPVHLHCQTCGSTDIASSAGPAGSGSTADGHEGISLGVRPAARGAGMHSNLVRSVALGDEFAVSGSYDMSIKVWDRKTGGLVADLTGGHTGRIFCVGFDCTKIVSCGEDQRICVWDFGHGIDTSFLELT